MNLSQPIIKYLSKDSVSYPYVVPMHTHIYYELVYYIGKGVTRINGIDFNYITGSYVIIPPNSPHSETALIDQEMYVFGFVIEGTPPELSNQILFDDTGKIRELLNEMLTELNQRHSAYRQRMNLLLSDILLLSMRKQEAGNTEPIDHKIDLIYNYLDNYYNLDINLKKLADSMAYSYDYLRHFFKEREKISMKEYILQKRIVSAKQLLLSNTSIQKIAQHLGFSSPAHFATVFRQKTGMSAREYRKIYQNNTKGNDSIAYPESDTANE